ncbi:MAG: hypothetical protein KBD63_08325 [Bacteriovoracaceae bacterium]|nr:hypothetical protein [Bacteriovoracaceae bacterium]
MFADDANVEHKLEDKKGEMTDEQGYYNVYSGKVVGKKYKLLDKIGKGVFGVVAKAEDESAERKEVALKILRKN